MKISNNIFFSMLIFGSLITISSNSWLSAWMGLEINLLSFIPLMNKSKNNLMTSESSLKYFIVQAFASSFLLFSIIMMTFFNINMIWQNNLNELLIMSILLLKMGTSPFHFWFPSVMEGLNWMNSFILMTWQKIAPMMLISYNQNYYFLLIPIILSMMIGALGGLNQTSLRKLMAYSSINHLGWMLMAMLHNELLWLIYFIIYTIISLSIILLFNNFNLLYFNQIFNINMNNSNLTFLLFINFLSLGGLPPFLGFLPKWLIIQNLIENNQLFLLFIAILFSLITLFYYLRLSYSIFMLNQTKTFWMMINLFNNKNMIFTLLMNFFTILGLIFILLIYLIM
uniref:NADH dehydrogenase subunit 2 n=1 Tax=Coquillettidia nigricans TaxID=1257098 RepID=UPI001EDC98F4|nr:NADH dehydrogenase subunit 2 [Coquillettidia nigricans]UIS24524.1 NADH dehydrogenase subunit 2 [Coquillettidia nigricans]